MSGFAAYFSPEEFIFATDTLVTNGDSFPVEKINNISKFNYYPHLKCCVVSLGYSRLGDDFYSFIQSLILDDLTDLVELTGSHFLNWIDPDSYSQQAINDGDKNYLGGLYVMGYSSKSQKLEAYELGVYRDKIETTHINTNVTMFVHPPIKEEIKNKIIDDVKEAIGSIDNVMIEFVRQMALDSESKDTHKVAVGMEIHLTHAYASNGHFCFTSTPYCRLPGFSEEFEEMQKKQNLPQCRKDRDSVKRDLLKLLDTTLEDSMMLRELEEKVRKVDFKALDSDAYSMLHTQNAVMGKLTAFSKFVLKKYSKLLLSTK